MQTCTACPTTGDATLFTSGGKLRKTCEVCRGKGAAARRMRYAANPEKERAATRDARAANPEKARANDRARYAANPEKKAADNRAWYATNPEKARASSKAFARRHPGKRTAWQLARVARKARAMPAWADRDAIEKIYIAAAWMRSLGHDVHVDHGYPLKGKKVSGLHVPGNLKIVAAVYNMRKHNKSQPDKKWT